MAGFTYFGICATRTICAGARALSGAEPAGAAKADVDIKDRTSPAAARPGISLIMIDSPQANPLEAT
jgi:hypothetical protein